MHEDDVYDDIAAERQAYADEDAAELRAYEDECKAEQAAREALQEAPEEIEPVTLRGESPAAPFTAWVTTSRSCLVSDFVDVVVLANDEFGASTMDEQFKVVTDRRFDDDNDGLLEEARALLVNAGWSLDGEWDGVPTGYIVNVTRD